MVGTGTAVASTSGRERVFARAAANRARWSRVDCDPAAVTPRRPRSRGHVPGGRRARSTAGPFDVVAAVQLIAHVTNPLAVLRARPVGGRVAVTVWGREQECACGRSVRLAAWPRRGGTGGPPPITEPARLRRLVELAGLRVDSFDDVPCPFDYPDADALVGPLLASGMGRHAANRAGPARCARRPAAAGREPDSDGGYRLQICPGAGGRPA